VQELQQGHVHGCVPQGFLLGHAGSLNPLAVPAAGNGSPLIPGRNGCGSFFVFLTARFAQDAREEPFPPRRRLHPGSGVFSGHPH